MRKPERGLMKKPEESCVQNSGNEMEGKRGGDNGQDDLEIELENLIRAAVKEEDKERWEAIQKELEEEGPFEYSAEEEKEVETRIAHARKMRKKAEKKERKKKHRILRIISASAAVLVLAVVVQSAIVKSVDASIETVVDVVVKWFEDRVEIKNETTENWLVKYDIKEPEYIPEGYNLIQVDEGTARNMKTYRNSSGELLKITCTTIKSGHTEIIDNEQKDVQNTQVSGFDALYFSSNSDVQFLYWNDGVIDYRIEAKIPLEEMIKIGESMMK